MSWRDKVNGGRMSAKDLVRSIMNESNPLSGKQGAESLMSAFHNLTSSMLPSATTPIKPKSKAKVPESERWSTLFSDMERMYPYHLRGRFFQPKEKIHLSHIFKDGTVVARSRIDDVEHNVFVRIAPDSDKPACGCNCNESRGKKQCEHSFRLVRGVLGLLKDPTSDFSKRINAANFSSGSLDPSMFHYDNSKQTLASISGLIRVSAMETEENFEELTPVVERDECRLAWNIRTTNGNYSIEPISQPRLKRGGFGKGKKCKLSGLYQEHLILSDADRRVRQQVKTSSDRYAESNTLKLEDALEHLVGEPNVYME
jgi:hypothetical protein